MSAIAHRGITTVRLPDGTTTETFSVIYDTGKEDGGRQIVLPSGRVKWADSHSGADRVDYWECHFASCAVATTSTAKHWEPQYDKNARIIESASVDGRLLPRRTSRNSQP